MWYFYWITVVSIVVAFIVISYLARPAWLGCALHRTFKNENNWWFKGSALAAIILGISMMLAGWPAPLLYPSPETNWVEGKLASAQKAVVDHGLVDRFVGGISNKHFPWKKVPNPDWKPPKPVDPNKPPLLVVKHVSWIHFQLFMLTIPLAMIMLVVSYYDEVISFIGNAVARASRGSAESGRDQPAEEGKGVPGKSFVTELFKEIVVEGILKLKWPFLRH